MLASRKECDILCGIHAHGCGVLATPWMRDVGHIPVIKANMKSIELHTAGLGASVGQSVPDLCLGFSAAY